LGALRHVHFLFGVRDGFITAKDPDDTGERTLHAWSPMLGASVALRPWLSIYGNLASSFQTPTTTELANQASGAGGFNPALGPERAHSVEAGAKARWSTAWLELAAYRSRVDSMLVGFEVPGFAGRQFYRNAGQALHRGIELGAGAQPTPGLSLRVALTLIDARFTRYELSGVDLAGNRVPGISPRRLESTAFWQGARGPFAALDLLAQSRTPVADNDSSQALASAGFYLLSLRSGWRELRVPGARLTPTLGIGNLLDRRYNTSVVVNAARGRFYEPGPGRTVYAGLEARLGRGP
jgi:iron complex outermembrane receptor protein